VSWGKAVPFIVTDWFCSRDQFRPKINFFSIDGSLVMATSEIALAVHPSICPLDCPDTCSLLATVEKGRLVGVKGSHANPYTAGAICAKVAHSYPEFVHGTSRLTQPLVRTGERGAGEFKVVTWSEALDRVHAGFTAAIDRYGAQSVLPLNYAGPHGQLAGASMDRRFFHKLGASLLDRGPLCAGVRGGAYSSLFGNAPGMAPDLATESDVIAVWGNNVTVSNLHFQRVVQSARKRGAQLVVVDPKRTRIARQAHLFVQIRPGTDVVLALALAAELERRGAFDQAFIERWVEGGEAFMQQAREYTVADVKRECRVSLQQFEQLVAIYAGAERLAVSVGNGIERSHSGGSGLRAIMSLNALLGQLGRPGAGVIAKPNLAVPATPDRLQRPDLIPPGTRTINIVDVGKLLLDESMSTPIKAVFIYNHNPVCTHPDQTRMRRALSQEKLFVVGSDVVMTDSMTYCDVVLPACSHFESHDLFFAYGQSYVQRAEPVIAPVGESLPNTEIFRRLAARFGYDEPMFLDDDAALMDAAIDGSDSRLEGYAPHALPLDRALKMVKPDGAPVLMCSTVEPATPSGKVELFSEALQQRFGYGVPRYDALHNGGPDQVTPLILISPSSSKRTNATFGGCDESDVVEVLEIHPDDARARRIAEGDAVRVSNARGEVVLRATISEDVQSGVLYSPKGTWLRSSETDQTVNALLSADIRTDILDGACYNDTFVEVERLPV
jgi:anaerobic selenocysteine-containing dehydrogenase